MIKFFTNREASNRLDINLSKWKRWSREFLPPDPLGGMQSGFARQYSPDGAFTVFFGGHLVADLKFTIPEAKQIIKDLHPWFAGKGFYFDAGSGATVNQGVDQRVKKYIIFIEREKDPDKTISFSYTIRGVISNEPVNYKGFEIMKELYMETTMGLQTKKMSAVDVNIVKTVNITDVLNNFVVRLNLNRSCYPALSLTNSSRS
ncbi:MAG: hypothetical protein JRF31_09495 [Deltaproteobacteria bacterium]|nr:hypothetical protein [Deltaproteobacteria bacterium]MBW2014461.1 hypothetical protein [Deltaproteobacteria bacterium]MBW2088304.1 hypothetical protein [Deltaproteobacteria bacterium]MBW2321056.1 hypothetical protein [Deltaproteobacteria bacterium]